MKRMKREEQRGRRGSVFDVGERTRTSALSKIQMGLKERGGGCFIGLRLQVREDVEVSLSFISVSGQQLV